MSAYSDRVIADGASNYWRLNETSGTSAVDLIGTAHGTITGGVTLGQAGALADGDKAMAFNGTNGKVQAAGPVTVPVTSTVELWLKMPTLAGDYTLVSTRGLGTGDLMVLYLTNGIPVYYSGGGGGGGGRVDNGQWRHLVFVFTTTTGSVYVDGALSGAPTAFTRTVASVGGVSFAWDNDNPLWFPGSLDEVAVYPRALTAPEILAHYDLRLATTTTRWPGVPWWTMIGGDEDSMESYNLLEAITPSDTVNLHRGLTDGVWVGGGGDVAVVMDNNVPIVLAAVPAGAWLPIAVQRINATGTSATGIIGLYIV